MARPGLHSFRRPPWIAALVGIAVGLDLLVLVTVPCPHSYLAIVPGETQEQLSVPSGVHVQVTVRWYQQQGASVNVFLLNGPALKSAKTVSNTSGGQGVLTFTTNAGQWWLLDTGAPISYTVSYYSPLL